MKVINSRKIIINKIFNIIFIISITVFLFYSGAGITHAINSSQPGVVVTVNGNGEIITEGSLFGDAMWYPGMKDHGVIRIQNNFKSFNISDLDLDVTLQSFKPGLNRQEVYDSFLYNMKLSLHEGKLMVFEDVIIDKKSLSELVDGFESDGAENLSIGKGESIDLKYTMQMDEYAGDELENTVASVDFVISVGEKI